MKHQPFWFAAVFSLYACGGSPKEPPQSPSDAPSASVVETQAEAPKPKAEAEAEKLESQPEPEATCEKDSDCTIFTDCCSCRAISQKAPLPPSCEGICGESKCEVKGKTIANVACVSGKCKLK